MPDQNSPVTPAMAPAPNTPAATPPPAMNATPGKKTPPKWLKIVVIVLIVLAIIFGVAAIVANVATKDAQKISNQFVNDIQAGDTDAAYNLTGKAFREATSKEQLDGIIKQVGPLLKGEEKLTDRSISKSTGVQTTAVLVYSVKTSDGTKYIKTELQKTGDSWQIINFRTSSKSLDTTVE